MSGEDRRRRRLSRILGVLARRADQGLRFDGERKREVVVGREQFRLTLGEDEFASPQVDALIPVQPQDCVTVDATSATSSALEAPLAS